MEAGVIVGWFFEKLFVRHLLVNSLHRPQLVGGDWKMTFIIFHIFPNSWDDDPIRLSYFSGG